MTESVRVACLLDRYWDPAEKAYAGVEKVGTLLEIATQSAEEDAGRLIPVGIVLMDDNTFQSVPMEFLKKATA